MPATDSTSPPHADSAMLRLIVDAATGMLAYFEAGTMRCRFATQAYARYYGLTSGSVLGKLPWEIMGPENWHAIAPHIEHCRRGEPVRYIRQQRSPQGALREIEVSITPHMEQGLLHGAVVKVHDLSADRAAEQQLRASEERMRKFSEATHEAIMLHRNGQLLDVNAALLRLTGRSIEELRGTPIFSHLAPEYWQHAIEVMLGGRDTVYEAEILHKNGHRIAVEIDARSMPGAEGDQDDRLVVIRDITARQQAQAQLRFLTQHDALTQLPNRWHLAKQLEQVLHSARQSSTPVAVLSLDLNHFSAINDSLGHAAGDQVLREVAQRLRSGLRDSDLVARVGSDEFIVVLAEGPSRAETEITIHQLSTLLEAPCEVAGQPLVIALSIGIAMFPQDGDHAEALLRNAVAARLLAKSSAQRAYQFYAPELEGRASRLLTQEQQLRQSIARGEFELHYQPQVRTDNGALAGFEALVRWRHPQRGLLAPEEFVHLAETRGLIGAIDRWVLRQACSQAQAWYAQGLPRVPMAVNMSAQEFRYHDLANEVATILTQTGQPAQLLRIEITESTLMHSDPQVQRTLRLLEQQGVEMAIDDFGTGYSSLAYLKRHPIHQLKIDRSFITDLTESDDDAAIVTAIVQMARSLRLGTLVEGVETAAQLACLRALGCDMVQGFYIAPPMSADAARQWQTDHPPAKQAQ